MRDIVLLNAAAGIVAYRLFQDATQVQRPILERLAEAKDAAAAAIDSGAAAQKLDAWVEVTRVHRRLTRAPDRRRASSARSPQR